jgi:hypothetical protein
VQAPLTRRLAALAVDLSPTGRGEELLRRLGRGPILGEILLHARRDAVLFHLVEPDLVDALVLILVFDLVAALLDVERHRALLAGLDAYERAAP